MTSNRMVLWSQDRRTGEDADGLKPSTRWILWSKDGTTGPVEGEYEPPIYEALATAHRSPDTLRADPRGRGTGAAMRHDVAVAPQGGDHPRRPRAVHRSLAAAIDQIITERAIEIAFQPVYDIEHEQVVGFEAFARGPQGELHAPKQLLAAARSVGRAGELDWVCRAAAFAAFLRADLPASMSLFVNVEPDSLIEPCPDDLLEVVWQAESQLRVFIDLPGRALARHPREVVESVRRARAARWGVAIDDIEYSAAGIALLPTIEPDVIKLNHHFLAVGSGHVSSPLSSVLAQAERTGARLLVENIEDATGSALARCIGGQYQQGHWLGRPAPLPTALPAPLAPLPLLASATPVPGTPWTLLSSAGARTASAVTQTGLDILVRSFAHEAANAAHPPVVAGVLSADSLRSPENQTLYNVLIERSPLALLLGRDIPPDDRWNVRSAELPPDHPLRNEMCFLALSPAMSTVLAAQRTAQADRQDPQWSLAISHDPALCRDVLRQLLDLLDRLPGGVLHEIEGLEEQAG